ncbi:MAG: sigma-70 family RNA polymerase sigma factor [Dehalococcoidia bacterium]|nr:sigma-70 family RNA polymerase sigma factor [Dehalococcoidia bacterium]
MSLLAREGSIRTTAQERTQQSAQVRREEELIRRAQEFDQEALGWLYQLFYPKLYNYAYLQLGDVQQAEDLASEVLLRVMESLKDYRFRGLPVSAWVFRIARNYVIDLSRRRQRRPQVSLYEGIPDTEASPHAAAERAIAQDELRLALTRLTEEQRQVIILKFVEGMDNTSVARVLGRSQGAVKSLQHRALVSLKRLLSSQEVE